MHMRFLLIAALAAIVSMLAAGLAAPAPARAWVNGGLGIGYRGPVWGAPVGFPCAPGFVPGGFVPVAPVPVYYAPPVVWAPPGVWVPPVVAWPSYGPDIAVRWNRYFTPEHPQIRGYTLPR